MGLAATVLFAEDDPSIRQNLAQFLSISGYRVLTAEDGFEALRLLTQQEIDLLLTDIVMPGLDGVELARKAKALRPKVPIMFLTGYSVKTGEAIHLGRLLHKPLRAEAIEAELRSILAH
jgi:two-component system, cell cycle response regulator CpdR